MARSAADTPYLRGGRELCVTGCAILWRGRSLLDRAIELVTAFSHCSLIVRMDEYLGSQDRVATLEALPGGLVPALFSKRAHSFAGEIWLFTPDGLTPAKRTGIRSFALRECLTGKGYDYLGFMAAILGHPRKRRGRYFCSEFYAASLDVSGVRRKASSPHLAPRPGDIPEWWQGELRKLTGPFL